MVGRLVGRIIEHHFHFGVEHVIFIGFAAMLFRYVWKLIAAQLAPADGMLGQFGAAMGGLAQ